jgi:choline dehydrogenase-like flavoprotein
MASGVGPADELRALGISVALDLADVGRHLEDHLLVAGVAYRAKRKVPHSHYNHADALLYAPRSNPDESPDILVMCLSLPFVLPNVGPLAPPAYVLTPCLMRPQSRGAVRLASSDPMAPALIDPGYLSESADLDILVEGVTLAREIGAASALADWRAEEVYPVRIGRMCLTGLISSVARQIRSTIPLGRAAWDRSSMRRCGSRASRACE